MNEHFAYLFFYVGGIFVGVLIALLTGYNSTGRWAWEKVKEAEE